MENDLGPCEAELLHHASLFPAWVKGYQLLQKKVSCKRNLGAKPWNQKNTCVYSFSLSNTQAMHAPECPMSLRLYFS